MTHTRGNVEALANLPATTSASVTSTEVRTTSVPGSHNSGTTSMSAVSESPTAAVRMPRSRTEPAWFANSSSTVGTAEAATTESVTTATPISPCSVQPACGSANTLVCRNSSKPATAFSRPMPDCL